MYDDDDNEDNGSGEPQGWNEGRSCSKCQELFADIEPMYCHGCSSGKADVATPGRKTPVRPRIARRG